MYKGLSVGTVIPAHDEEDNIGAVVSALLELRGECGQPVIDDIVVCDNASTDATARRALDAGARVATETTPGYGQACMTAIAALRPVDVVLFVDGDQAFDVRQSFRLLAAIEDGADLAIGSRVLGRMEGGALSLPQIVGNRVAGLLIRLLWAGRVTDLGPFRAIRADALRCLEMRDTAYGWTVEMQIKAIQSGMRLVETPVDTRRRRFGTSKIGGTVKGVVGASAGILATIFRLSSRRAGRVPPKRAYCCKEKSL
jgi:glycosyltransferase involved in cell wall biosynthesis